MWQFCLVNFGHDDSGIYWTSGWVDCTAKEAALLGSAYVPVRLV